MIRPVLEYCAPVFHHALPQYLSDDIERVQKRALSIICPYASYSECLVRFDLVTLHARRVALCSKLFESITSCPDHKLVPVLPPKREHRHNLRQSRAYNYAMPRTHTNRFKTMVSVLHTNLSVAGLALFLVAFARATLVVLRCSENGTAVLSIEL